MSAPEGRVKRQSLPASLDSPKKSRNAVQGEVFESPLDGELFLKERLSMLAQLHDDVNRRPYADLVAIVGPEKEEIFLHSFAIEVNGSEKMRELFSKRLSLPRDNESSLNPFKQRKDLPKILFLNFSPVDFKNMKRWLYTGGLDSSPVALPGLLRAARYFDLPSLSSVVEADLQVAHLPCPDTRIWDICAELRKNGELRLCELIRTAHAMEGTKLLERPEVANLSRDGLGELLSSDLLLVPESVCYRAAWEWTKKRLIQDQSGRLTPFQRLQANAGDPDLPTIFVIRDILGPVLGHIRMGLMSHQVLDLGPARTMLIPAEIDTIKDLIKKKRVGDEAEKKAVEALNFVTRLRYGPTPRVFRNVTLTVGRRDERAEFDARNIAIMIRTDLIPSKEPENRRSAAHIAEVALSQEQEPDNTGYVEGYEGHPEHKKWSFEVAEVKAGTEAFYNNPPGILVGEEVIEHGERALFKMYPGLVLVRNTRIRRNNVDYFDISLVVVLDFGAELLENEYPVGFVCQNFNTLRDGLKFAESRMLQNIAGLEVLLITNHD